jgi:hypothetical protein
VTRMHTKFSAANGHVTDALASNASAESRNWVAVMANSDAGALVANWNMVTCLDESAQFVCVYNDD